MEIYSELQFTGTQEELNEFIETIGYYAKGDWFLEERKGRWKNYLFFNYNGKEVDKSKVSIYIGEDDVMSGELHVGNIIPIEKSQLSIDEYNKVLQKFYDDVIKPYKKSGSSLNISELTSDEFDPLSEISKTALKKLEKFCKSANKSTGSSHPSDRNRWFDFICQTVDDGRVFDYAKLARFLQDENHWGKKAEDFIGVIGHFAWDKEKAYELANEYESLCEILIYYKKERGI
ncbi:hypothetical protein [Terrisporobacter hibernicus]|uniref:Uncharacterized protein n=1 Tax=Terrisporobacter hibernicus TaxID=2813371 RepID=A0AAX2ZKU6_9FIRM|nr:hypothetical protein [Terrisporobacter hibernicus]UEL48292.1 hypothetical protein JW646_02230 [Terrisporobacter hibernicus]